MNSNKIVKFFFWILISIIFQTSCALYIDISDKDKQSSITTCSFNRKVHLPRNSIIWNITKSSSKEHLWISTYHGELYLVGINQHFQKLINQQAGPIYSVHQLKKKEQLLIIQYDKVHSYRISGIFPNIKITLEYKVIHSQHVKDLVFYEERNLAFSSDVTGLIKTFNISNGSIVKERNFSKSNIREGNIIYSMGINQKDSYIAIIQKQAKPISLLRINDLSSFKEYQIGNEKATKIKVFTQNPKVAIGYENGKIGILDTNSGVIKYLPNGHERWQITIKGLNLVQSLAIDNSEKYLFSTAKDKNIIVWDLVKERKLVTLSKHEHPVLTIYYDEYSKQLVSGDASGHIFWWKCH